MQKHDFQSFLAMASDIAKDAAQDVLKNLIRYQEVRLDLFKDVKVVADNRLEEFLIEQLSMQSGFPILSEESGLLEGREIHSDYRWIIDPLDGSLNFSLGIPMYCISIALWEGMDPLLGVVYDFSRDECFTGLVGKGAWLNGTPIKVSEVTEKAKAVLCTGFPVNTNFSSESLLDFIEKIKKYKKIRLFGSAALSLAYVACGRADVYMENDIKIWDVAGGIALVKAAGGAIKMQPSIKENALLVKAANENLLDAVE
jgi:myo-inositol-1(or 4)-monophosphatase